MAAILDKKKSFFSNFTSFLKTMQMSKLNGKSVLNSLENLMYFSYFLMYCSFPQKECKTSCQIEIKRLNYAIKLSY